MTGPEHYEAAESLIQEAQFALDEPEKTILTYEQAMIAAQVHATLALAAATALAPASDVGTGADWTAWFEAASEAETGEQP